MIVGVDSAYPPSLASCQAARAAGVSMWNGYIATRGGLGLLRPWSQGEFNTVKSVFGGRPLAFCSGWDSPEQVRALADAWGVRLCIDIENGIRDDGPWVDGFVARSGAGIYGLTDAMYHDAPFKVAAGYPTSGNPIGFTWPGVPPAVPHGWQWAGTHDAFGATIDTGDYDDWFLSGAPAPVGPVNGGTEFYTSGGDDTMVALSTPGGRLDVIYVGTDGHVYHRWQNDKINDLAADVESWGGGVTKVAACYTDGGNTIAVFAAVENGDVWFKEIGTDGHVVNEWTAMGGGFTVAASGSAGGQGPAGDKGPEGDPGPQGPPGAKGPAGDKGPTGDKGPQGDPGKSSGPVTPPKPGPGCLLGPAASLFRLFMG